MVADFNVKADSHLEGENMFGQAPLVAPLQLLLAFVMEEPVGRNNNEWKELPENSIQLANYKIGA